MPKRECPQCNRNLLDSIVDKCMYCGFVLPENLKLSDEKKEIIEKRLNEAHEETQRRHRAKKPEKPSVFDYYHDVDLDNYDSNID